MFFFQFLFQNETVFQSVIIGSERWIAVRVFSVARELQTHNIGHFPQPTGFLLVYLRMRVGSFLTSRQFLLLGSCQTPLAFNAFELRNT